jgi:hypothetical protein
LASAAGLEPAVTGIKIRRLGQLGDAPKNFVLQLVLPTGVQPAKSSVESAVPLAPGDGRLVRAAGIEPNTSCLEDRHAAHYATPAKNLVDLNRIWLYGRPRSTSQSKAQKMVRISGYVVVNVTGLASAGTVSAQGLRAGDRIIQASSPSLPGNVNIFEAVVSVDDELQQFTAFGSSTAVAFEILALRL